MKCDYPSDSQPKPKPTPTNTFAARWEGHWSARRKFESGGVREEGNMGKGAMYVHDQDRPQGPRRPRNDLGQYDDLVDEWWNPAGAFAALHWLAASRQSLIPTPVSPHDVLVDVGCGAGLMANATLGYVHIGVDLVTSGLERAQSRGVYAVRANAACLPLASSSATVVVAGEILEHVTDLDATVKEVCRVLRPGGTVVIDTINDTRLAKFLMVTIAERLPGGPPRGIHDPNLFVNPKHLQKLFADHGVDLNVWGLRPSVPDYLRFVLNRTRSVRMLPSGPTAVVYQGRGTKRREA